MKKIRLLPKIVAFLLPALLIINATDAIGSAWCFGDDGHVEIKNDSCVDSCQNSAGPAEAAKQDLQSLLEIRDESCGPCLDLYLNQAAATTIKRFKKTSFPSLKIAKTSSLPFSFPQNLTTYKPLPQPLRQVSRAIIAHRTVVLLH